MLVGNTTLSIRVLYPFGAVLESEGVSPRLLLDAAQIPTAIYYAADGRISYSAAGRFLTAASERSACAALGLEAARRLDRAQFQLLEYLSASSPDVNSALETLIRHQKVFGDQSVLSLEDLASGRLLRFQPSQGTPRCFIEYAVGALAWAGVRAGPTQDARAELGQIWFAYRAPRQALAAYREFFASEPRFEAAAHGIFVPHAQLKQPMTRANVGLQSLLASQISTSPPPPAPLTTTTERVRVWLDQQLVGTPPDLAKTARRLSMSVSTLKRKLAREGRTYSGVLDELRRDTSLRLLGNPALSISEVAYLTGYTDATAFDKAFRRWRGQSPSQHRGKRLPET